MGVLSYTLRCSLVAVLEGIHDLCQAEGSTNQDRFLACQAPQKVS